MNTAVSASVVLVSMVPHVKISVKLRHGDPNVSQGSNNVNFRSDELIETG